MIATHRVKDYNNETMGFIIDENFYADYFVTQNMHLIDNLTLTSNGVIRAKKELPVINYTDINKRVAQEIEINNPFVRDIQKELLEWKNKKHEKVLQLEGSRQIGKTTELLKFAYKNYMYTIYVNISSDINGFISEISSNGINPIAMERYCRNARLPHYVDNKNTILIIDEIQVSSKVYNWIRALRSNLKCGIIVTGSYLGQTLNKEYFQPAGTVAYAQMFPLSFSEFCRVFKKEKDLKSVSLYGSDTDKIYDDLYKLYSIYKQIGGYPDVVKEFMKSKSIKDCYIVIRDLLNTFEKESGNYFKDPRDATIFSVVYTEAIKEMCREKRGSGKDLIETVTSIAKSSPKLFISREEIARAVQWVKYCGVIGDCDLCNNGSVRDIIPARRLYYMDCGIASYAAIEAKIPEGERNGFITENFVYTELYRLYKARDKKVIGSLPSFALYNDYELDFMVVSEDSIIYGIEVKTKTGVPKSLKVFIDKGLVDKGIVAKNTTGGHGDKFDTIPIYTVGARFPYK